MAEYEEKCDSCGTSRPENDLHNCEKTVGRNVVPVKLCSVCYGSATGKCLDSSTSDPYRGNRVILMAIAQCTNMILDEIRRIK